MTAIVDVDADFEQGADWQPRPELVARAAP